VRQSTRVIVNSAFSLGQQLVSIGLQIFLLAFILRRVTSEAYAILLLAGSVQLLIYALRDAINKGCVTHIARYREERNEEMASKVVSTASMFLLVPAIGVMIASLFIGPYLSQFFNIRPDLQSTMNWGVMLVGVNILFVLPLFPFRSTVEAYQRYDLIAYVNVGSRLIRAAIIVVAFLMLRANILYVMIATVIADVGTQWIMYFFAHRLMPSLHVRPGLVNPDVLKALLSFGSFLVLTTLARIGSMEGTKWIIGKILSLEYITFLTIAGYFVAVLNMMVQTVTLVLVPVASRYKSLKADSALSEMLLRGTRYAAVISMGVMSVLLPVITPLISLWLKLEMAWIGPYAAVLGVCGALYLPYASSMQILVGTGDTKRPFLVVLTGGVVTIATVTLATGVLPWGFAGAVLGVCIGWIVIGAGMTFLALRTIPVNRAKFVRQGYLEPILAAIPAGGIGWFLSHFFPVDTWPGLLGVCSLSFLAYVVCFLPLLTKQEWQMVHVAVRRLTGVFSARLK